MNVRNYLALFAILGVLFGIGFILAPGAVLANYGITATPPALALMARLFGGALIAIAIIEWLARDFDASPMRAVLVAAGVSSVINGIVATMATLAGTTNALGWSTVVIYLVGALGAGYFLMNPDKR